MKLCLSALIALAALAGSEERRRFEYLEDFEEAPPKDAVYAGWERLSSPAHPAWNRIEWARDPEGARSGEHYLRMTTQGGSTALQMLKKIAWPIDPARSYRLSALVRLTAARANLATFTVTWLDRRFAVLDETASSPVAGPGGWREIALDLPSLPAGTMWAIVRINFEGADVQGECCFDRLMLTRPPRLRILPADRRLPVFDPSTSPRFNIVARELAEGAHQADLKLRRPDGTVTPLHSGLPVRDGAVLPVELPRLEPGAYTLIASVSGPDRVAIDRECPVLIPNRPWLEVPRQASLVGGSFDPFAREYVDAPKLAELGGFHRARVALWHREKPGERKAPEAGHLFDFVRRLSELPAVSVVGLVDAPPAPLFPDVDPATLERGTRALLQIDRKAWEAPLRATALRYREFVPLWQPADALVKTEDLLKTFDGERVATLEPDGPEEILRRLVIHAASAAGAPPVFIPVDRLLDADGYPGPAFLALRAANDVLSGAVPRPDLPPLLGPPVKAAFEKGGRAILVLWSETGDVDREFNLGADAEVLPALGAVRRHVPGERLRAGAMPVFIGKVDPSFLETQLSLRLADPADPSAPGNTLPLRADPVTRILKFRNRSRQSEITNLRVRLEDPLPPDWIVRPIQARDLSIAPGKELNHELTFVLPPTESEGERPLGVELLFTQDGRPQSVRERIAIRVAPQIEISVQVTDDPGIDDAKRVSVRVTNATSRKMTLVAAVRLPNRPEQTEPLGTLEPKSPAERTLEYLVRDVRLIDSAALKIEVLCEERGGDRLYARKSAPLK